MSAANKMSEYLRTLKFLPPFDASWNPSRSKQTETHVETGDLSGRQGLPLRIGHRTFRTLKLQGARAVFSAMTGDGDLVSGLE